MKKEDSGLVIARSAYSVGETLDRISHVLTQAGNTVFARIDHAQNAAAAGLSMRQTQVLIWGNPTAGTALMNQAPTLAIDLPQRLLAWEDADGNTWLAYNSMVYYARRHELRGFDTVTAGFDERLDSLLRAVTGDEPQSSDEQSANAISSSGT